MREWVIKTNGNICMGMLLYPVLLHILPRCVSWTRAIITNGYIPVLAGSPPGQDILQQTSRKWRHWWLPALYRSTAGIRLTARTGCNIYTYILNLWAFLPLNYSVCGERNFVKYHNVVDFWVVSGERVKKYTMIPPTNNYAYLFITCWENVPVREPALPVRVTALSRSARTRNQKKSPVTSLSWS